MKLIECDKCGEQSRSSCCEVTIKSWTNDKWFCDLCPACERELVEWISPLEEEEEGGA